MADPTALYSYKGAVPTTLPNRIRLSDGTVRTDISSFSDGEITDAGYTGPYVIPGYDQEYQNLSWNSKTLSYVVEDLSDEQIWNNVRITRNRLLAESDWTMAADSPGELNLQEWEKYRQRLRDLPKTFKDPKNIVWPTDPPNTEHFDLEPVIEDRIRWRVTGSEQRIDSLIDRIIALESKVGIATT